eukprot:5600198-Pleurochrysis_carterae.AAC.1
MNKIYSDHCAAARPGPPRRCSAVIGVVRFCRTHTDRATMATEGDITEFADSADAGPPPKTRAWRDRCRHEYIS